MFLNLEEINVVQVCRETVKFSFKLFVLHVETVVDIGLLLSVPVLDWKLFKFLLSLRFYISALC